MTVFSASRRFRSLVTLPMICFCICACLPKVVSYHLKTQTSGMLFAFQLKETSLLKSAHTTSFELLISS